MEETKRKERNAQMVLKLEAGFRIIIEQIIVEMEGRGFRPRIQEADRSPADQLQAFKTGHSKLKFGFHNITGPNGEPRSMAVDLIDDDYPLASRPSYLLNLAQVARKHGVQTGILWGLNPIMQMAVNNAIDKSEFDSKVKIGWDPTHIEPIGITPEQAQAKQK